MRFYPAIAELRSQIRDGKIGDVQYVYVSFGYVRPPEMERHTDPELGGGAILSLGMFTINLATMIFGGEEPESIHASGWLTSTGVDEVAAITLKYSGQRVAQLMCSLAYNTPNEAIVLGTKGQLKLPVPFWCPTKLDTPEVSEPCVPLPCRRYDLSFSLMLAQLYRVQKSFPFQNRTSRPSFQTAVGWAMRLRRCGPASERAGQRVPQCLCERLRWWQTSWML